MTADKTISGTALRDHAASPRKPANIERPAPKLRTPSYYAKLKGGRYDISGRIGPLFVTAERQPEWPMFSFERGGYVVWNAIGRTLHKRGWSDKQIKGWLQSKDTRWALDGSLGDALVAAAEKWVADAELTPLSGRVRKARGA